MNRCKCKTLASLALLAAAPSFAQTTAADDLDQILVTGARAPLAGSQLGSAVTVITAEDIEQRQARYVSELLRTVPGFSVSQSGPAGSQTQVRVRGAEANHVLVLIDGIRANDPATGDEFRWEYLTTSNIERIEVVRGPQSSLWGSDAVAAVVQIITRSGKDEGGMNLYAETGSFDTMNLGGGAGIAAARWSFNGAVERLDTDGFNVSREGSEKDGSDITTASATAGYRPSDVVSVDVSLRLTDAFTEFDSVDFVQTGLPADADLATEADNVYARVAMSYGAAESRLRQQLRLDYFASDNRNLSDGNKDSTSEADRSSVAYQADIALGGDLLSLALEHERSRFRQRGAIGFGDPNQDQEMDVTSVIADYQGRSLDRLTWLLSARFDDNSDFEDAWSGRLSLAYTLTDTTTLRGNIGMGRKNPTFTDLFGYFPGQFSGNPNLKPEQSTSYDIGIDTSFADGALNIELSLFSQDLEDEINGFVFDPATFLFTAENMDGTSRRRGAELAAAWRAFGPLELSASYTYTDSEQPDASGRQVREIRRPKHSASLSLAYRPAGSRFHGLLGADYGGTRNDEFYPPFPEPSRIVTLDRYLLLGLTLHYKVNDSLALYAKGDNLLDEDYEQVYGYRTAGIAGYVGLRMNFGE